MQPAARQHRGAGRIAALLIWPHALRRSGGAAYRPGRYRSLSRFAASFALGAPGRCEASLREEAGLPAGRVAIAPEPVTRPEIQQRFAAGQKITIHGRINFTDARSLNNRITWPNPPRAGCVMQYVPKLTAYPSIETSTGGPGTHARSTFLCLPRAKRAPAGRRSRRVAIAPKAAARLEVVPTSPD